MDTFSTGPMGEVERKLPVIGQAVENAIEKLTERANPFVFFLLIVDTSTGKLAYTSNGETESMRAALAEFLAHHSH